MSVLLHLYLDGLLRNKTGWVASRSTVVKVASAFHLIPVSLLATKCGKPGNYSSSCALPAKAKGERTTSGKPGNYSSSCALPAKAKGERTTSPPTERSISGTGDSAGQKWCTAVCIGRPCTTTPCVTRKGLCSHRRAMRTRRLW